MRNPSLLRYPGGKTALYGLLGRIRKLNGLGERSIAEPFAGGAGASLKLLILEETPDIYVNDADSAIYDFWWSAVHRSKSFSNLIAQTRVNMTEWRRQRDIYRSCNRISRLRKGFAAFYLNRCNRSGIIMNGGPIGGVKQTGPWKINARFNKRELRERCTRIAEYRTRIHVSGMDGIKFIDQLSDRSTFYFIDPPYFEKGKTLYLNSLTETYHSELAHRLKTMPDAAWVLTYDDCPEIRKLYRGWASIRPFALRYAASARRSGKEILISPKWMKLPSGQDSLAIVW